MTLKEIRKMFIDLTGRYDLVEDTIDYVDISANFFITQGQKFLDSRIPMGTGIKGRIIAGMGEGENVIEVPFARAIERVAITLPTDTSIVWYLTPKTPEYVNAIAGLPNIGDINKGRPEYWASNPARIADEFATDQDILRSIIVGPCADQVYNVEVFGTFMSRPFTTDMSQTYWSVAYPEILIQAAMYKLEVTYRNTEGANDHLRVIDEALQGIYYDFIEEDSAGKNQMGNTW